MSNAVDQLKELFGIDKTDEEKRNAWLREHGYGSLATLLAEINARKETNQERSHNGQEK